MKSLKSKIKEQWDHLSKDQKLMEVMMSRAEQERRIYTLRLGELKQNLID